MFHDSCGWTRDRKTQSAEKARAGSIILEASNDRLIGWIWAIKDLSTSDTEPLINLMEDDMLPKTGGITMSLKRLPPPLYIYTCIYLFLPRVSLRILLFSFLLFRLLHDSLAAESRPS